MAPSSLLSAVAHLPTSSAGLPHPSGSALVWRRPSSASGLHSSGCTSSLWFRQAPSSPQLLLSPLSLWLHRGHLDSHLRLGHRCDLLRLGLRILPVALALRLSISASGSTCSVAIGRPPGVGGHSYSTVPPSVGCTVGRCYGCGLGPAVCLLLRVPPVSSLVPSS